AKDAERIEPKGAVACTEVLPPRGMDNQRYRRIESTSPMRVNRVEGGKPVSFLSQEREGSRQADPWRCGYGGGKKRRPSCNGTDTGWNITRRASAQTSLRCLGTRTMEESIQKVLQMTVAFLHWCSLPRQGIDVCLVSPAGCLTADGSFTRPLRCLSRMKGNFHVRF